MVWMMTTAVSLGVVSCEVDSIRALSSVYFGFSATMAGVDSATLDALAVVAVGLETTLLGLVFSASALAFLLTIVVCLSYALAFCFTSFSSLIFHVASYLALSAFCSR